MHLKNGEKDKRETIQGHLFPNCLRPISFFFIFFANFFRTIGFFLL